MSDRGVLGVDVGGTFTDVVWWGDGHLTTRKVATTPDQSEGVVAGALDAAAGPTGQFLHGTTAATNALLEGNGATTALVTSPGFADVIEIARQDRPALYDTFADRPAPLVDPSRRFEAADARSVPRDLGGAESVAVCLIDGYRRSDDEATIVAGLRDAFPEMPISASSVVAPEFREYERSSTTVLNAYLVPTVGRYLAALAARAKAAGLPSDIVVMRSSGGVMGLDAATSMPVHLLLSGPAAGAVAAAGLASLMGHRRVIGFDMGGTSTDVCPIDDGEAQVLHHGRVGGYACLMPSVAIHTVGAGGGSVAWVDAGGSLRVGPRSSGAVPGPASYGRGGTEPTVTDANVVLGRLDPTMTLGDGLTLDLARARSVVGELGAAVALDPAAAAAGVVAVAEEVMAGAVRHVSIEQGSDPRDASLLAYGGAGGLHATALARRLGMHGVIIPPHAGVFSALGLLMAAPRADTSRTVMLDDADRRLDAVVAATADALEKQGTVTTAVDVRYRGQAHEITVPYTPGDGWERLRQAFHRLHRARNGFAREGEPVEAVTVRAAATGLPSLTWDRLGPVEPSGEPARGRRDVIVGGEVVDAQVVNRAGLGPGAEVTGPAVIEEAAATTLLAPGERGRVHDSGALEVEW